MRAEIQKIMEMNKAGTLTDEQATDLLSALAAGKQPGQEESAQSEALRAESGNAHASAGRGSHWERFADHAFQAADHAFRAFDDLEFHHLGRHMRHAMRDALRHGRHGGHEPWGWQTDGLAGDNAVTRSNVDAPRGERFVFKGNQIDCSHLADIHLQDASLEDNFIRATRLVNLSVVSGKLNQSSLLASSADGFTIDHGEAVETRIRASKWRNVHIKEGSAIAGLQINACSIDGLTLAEKSTWTGSTVHGVALSDVKIVDSTLNDLGLMAAHFRDMRVTGCRADKLLMRGVGFKDAAFVNCELRDVLFSGHGGWKWKRPKFEDVRFEGCRFDSVLFADCRFNNTTVRNVTVTDLKIKGIDLSGQEIDGNEAFLKAVRKA